MQKGGKYTITICELKHTCVASKHKWRGPTHQALWLAETLAPQVVRNTNALVKELINGLKMDYKKSTNYQQMFKARELVRDWYLGDQHESFHKIPTLLDRIKEVDTECVVDWAAGDETRVFKRAFICPSATRDALRYTQSVICLDACHTKNKKYPSQLFVAIVLDGEMQVYILCYALAPVENTNNWTWFLEMMDRSICRIKDEAIPFISDRQKGLVAAIRDVFPEKLHGHCAQNLRGNVKTNHGKVAVNMFWGAVYAYTKNQ